MARDLARLLGSLAILALVLLTTAGFLKGLDGVSRTVAGVPADRSFSSVAEAERALGVRLALPSYFPETLRWPPASIRTSGRRRNVAVIVGFTAREGGPERLILTQTIASPGPLPSHLPPQGLVQDSQPVRIGAASGTLVRLHGVDGAIWYKLEWESRGRSLQLSSRGSLEQLFKLAESVRREGP